VPSANNKQIEQLLDDLQVMKTIAANNNHKIVISQNKVFKITRLVLSLIFFILLMTCLFIDP